MGWLKGRYMIDACSITKYLWPTPSTIDQYRILVLPLYQEQPQNLNFEVWNATDVEVHRQHVSSSDITGRWVVAWPGCVRTRHSNRDPRPHYHSRGY
uniref:Ras-related small GTP-binding family protein n=1 Tax=Haemonchus contortus TaxID=6289 RepID=A0A7I4Z4K6_HAECO